MLSRDEVKVRVDTSRFGSLEYEEHDVFTFPDGLFGFSKLRRFLLVERVDDDLFLWLQSLEKTSVAFPVIEPQIIEPAFRPELDHADSRSLGGKSAKARRFFAIVTIPSEPTLMTANLKAPIAINLDERVGRQVILENADYPIRKSIYALLEAYCGRHSRTVFPSEEVCSYKPHRLEPAPRTLDA